MGLKYFILFLKSIPRCPVKITEEKNLKLLINNKINENINILLNNFKLYYGDKAEKDFNIIIMTIKRMIQTVKIKII